MSGPSNITTDAAKMQWSNKDPRPAERTLTVVAFRHERSGKNAFVHTFFQLIIVPDGKVWTTTPSGDVVSLRATDSWPEDLWWIFAPPPVKDGAEGETT